jgi:hypothetical protein
LIYRPIISKKKAKDKDDWKRLQELVSEKKLINIKHKKYLVFKVIENKNVEKY